jgi:hypothetical protein
MAQMEARVQVSLRSDLRWIRDALDCRLHGALPTYPPNWHTQTGKWLAGGIEELWRKYYETAMENMTLHAKVAHLTAEVDGLRATNEILTDESEAFRGRKA